MSLRLSSSALGLAIALAAGAPAQARGVTRSDRYRIAAQGRAMWVMGVQDWSLIGTFSVAERTGSSLDRPITALDLVLDLSPNQDWGARPLRLRLPQPSCDRRPAAYAHEDTLGSSVLLEIPLCLGDERTGTMLDARSSAAPRLEISVVCAPGLESCRLGTLSALRSGSRTDIFLNAQDAPYPIVLELLGTAPEDREEPRLLERRVDAGKIGASLGRHFGAEGLSVDAADAGLLDAVAAPVQGGAPKRWKTMEDWNPPPPRLEKRPRRERSSASPR